MEGEQHQVFLAFRVAVHPEIYTGIWASSTVNFYRVDVSVNWWVETSIIIDMELLLLLLQLL